MTRRRFVWARRVTLVLAVLALAAPAAAATGVRFAGVDAGGYPQIQATVIGPMPTASPPALTENGRAVVGAQAQNLGREKAVALVLDRSRSMKGAALADAKAAARTFAGLKPASDRIGVVAFGSRATALTGFSTGIGDVDTALAAVGVDSRTGTALYDAVVLAARQLEAQPLPGRVIVLLTDGDDVSSAATLDEAIAAARRAHAGVYPVAVSGAGFDPAPLARLAHSTGGTYHLAGSSSMLAQMYAQIASELARTWRVRYTTSARPGETLRLRATLGALGAAEASPTIPGRPSPPGSGSTLPDGVYGTVGTAAVAGAVALLVLVACALVFSAGGGMRLRSRLEAHVAAGQPGAKRRRPGGRTSLATQVFRATERVFGDLRQFRSLQRLLERADLPLRASEFLYIQFGVGLFSGIVFALFGAAPLFVVGAMAGGAFLPRSFASFRAGRRLSAFENQLPDLLITIAASLKAGHSFRQGIQTVVDEGHPPASDEFRRVLTETSLGRPMDDALTEMAERVGSKNLEFVMTAVTIQRQVGGSLAGLFDMVAEAVRQRQQFARKIKSLTAMGRMSAYTLIGLPLFLLAMLTLMNRTYMSPLYHTSTGHKLIVIGLLMMAFGTLVLRKIVSFRG